MIHILRKEKLPDLIFSGDPVRNHSADMICAPLMVLAVKQNDLHYCLPLRSVIGTIVIDCTMQIRMFPLLVGYSVKAVFPRRRRSRYIRDF